MLPDPMNVPTPRRGLVEIRRQLADLARLKDAAQAYGTPDFASRAGLEGILAHERSLIAELRAAERLESGGEVENKR